MPPAAPLEDVPTSLLLVDVVVEVVEASIEADCFRSQDGVRNDRRRLITSYSQVIGDGYHMIFNLLVKQTNAVLVRQQSG